MMDHVLHVNASQMRSVIGQCTTDSLLGTVVNCPCCPLMVESLDISGLDNGDCTDLK